MEFNEDIDFGEIRKELNRELKNVERGYSPTQALEELCQMWQLVLDMCTDNNEILGWTVKMIDGCTDFQAAITMSRAMETNLLKVLASSQCFSEEEEEQENE
ncbi:MAG: hypothetical protein KIB08_06290 [Negativicoccus succinicivorans]|uniref:hypothetical protein n=1 Tax=Negativicoccus succinicivorans TaxID=620903 RepID=UPI0026EABD7E|nr:hypothetical protein [Negativicoccus succinicivorans]MBS5888097.1 hypothetical protein [Negativicoccus succinicivorans]